MQYQLFGGSVGAARDCVRLLGDNETVSGVMFEAVDCIQGSCVYNATAMIFPPLGDAVECDVP